MKTKTKVPLKSLIKERLMKIRSGTVYNGKLRFINELGQNALRAKATKVWISLENDTLIIKDNGEGCSKPLTLFTLDHSGFGVGFGEGFTSIYTIADEFTVRTSNWIGYLNIAEKLDNPKATEEDLFADVDFLDETIDGFHLTLKGPDITEYRMAIENEVREFFTYIPHIDAYLNGEEIKKRDLFEKISDMDYPIYVDNRYYTGKIGVTSHQYDAGIEVYFEYRPVQTLRIDGAKGVIQLKPNAVNLKAPDRSSIIYDEKRDRLTNHLRRQVKEIFKKLVKQGDRNEIDNFAKIIQEYLSVNEYINCLQVDNSFLTKTPEQSSKADVKNIAMDAQSFYEMIDADSPIVNPPTNFPTSTKHEDEKVEEEKDYQPQKNIQKSEMTIENDDYKANEESDFHEGTIAEKTVDTERKLSDRAFSAVVSVNEYVKKEQVHKLTIKELKRKKNIVWCKADEKEKYQHFISEFEYKNVFTFISPHVLYDNALKHLGIPHVSEYENCILEEYEVIKTGARNMKEQRAMELLSFIEDKYGLSETFFVSEIKCKRKIELNGKKVHQEKVTVNGYKQYSFIHLNRKSLFFGNIRGSRLGEKTLNVHDLKFIVANSSLIGHELAHLLYGTKDNTKEHLEREKQLRDEIVDFFVRQSS